MHKIVESWLYVHVCRPACKLTFCISLMADFMMPPTQNKNAQLISSSKSVHCLFALVQGTHLQSAATSSRARKRTMGNAQSRFRGALIYVALNSIHHLLERSSKKVGLEGNLRMILPFLYSLAIIHGACWCRSRWCVLVPPVVRVGAAGGACWCRRCFVSQLVVRNAFSLCTTSHIGSRSKSPAAQGFAMSKYGTVCRGNF